MLLSDKILLTALQHVTCENSQVCRLCLTTVEKGAVSVEDRLKLKTFYYDENISVTTMFQELGVASEPELPQVLCSNCAKNTVNAYLFQKLCQFSNNSWIHVLKKLSDSLTQTDTISSDVQCVYLLIKQKDNMLFTGRKSNLIKDKKTVLAKIKDIAKSRHKYLKSKQTIIDTICEECGQRFTTKSDLVKHLKVHAKSQIPCTRCPKIFGTPLQLEEHAERVHHPKKLHCPRCPKKFSTGRLLKVHNTTFHVPVKCKLCNLQFPSRKDLRAHLDKHQSYTCPKCGKKYTNKYTVRQHLETCGNPQEKQASFICDICNKSFAGKNGIRSHLKVDHGFGDLMSCNWCGKKFDVISKLRNHIVKHTKEKNFPCEQCGGKFVTQAALVYHTRLHTGERPYACDMCDERFLSASRRTEHKKRKHFGPTLECHVCHIKFVTAHELRKHVQRHYNPQSKLYMNENGIMFSNNTLMI